jgi:hypothetical protein
MALQRFWLVARNEFRLVTEVRHTTEAAAVQEATRLCRRESVEFLVLECVGVCRSVVTPVEYTPTSYRAGWGNDTEGRPPF